MKPIVNGTYLLERNSPKDGSICYSPKASGGDMAPQVKKVIVYSDDCHS